VWPNGFWSVILVAVRAHQEWVKPLVDYPEYFVPYAAGIPGKLRMIYSQDQFSQLQGNGF